MSSTYLCPSVEHFVEVIVRAYGNEPAVLQAIGGDINNIDVIVSDTCKSIAYPSNYVYEYNAELFNQLESAYTEGNTEKLEQTWKQAKHYKID